MKRVLITGAGTGFGQEVAMRLAAKGFDVVATVEIYAQVQTLKRHEAIAETMKLELQEFGIEVATVNPGPFLTGFNDRMFQTYQSWSEDPTERLYDYEKLAFSRPQFDPEAVYATMTAVAAGERDTYRNLDPEEMIDETKDLIMAPWEKTTTDGLGTRPDQIQNSYDMEPETPVLE